MLVGIDKAACGISSGIATAPAPSKRSELRRDHLRTPAEIEAHRGVAGSWLSLHPTVDPMKWPV